jgi:hypothetical protein
MVASGSTTLLLVIPHEQASDGAMQIREVGSLGLWVVRGYIHLVVRLPFGGLSCAAMTVSGQRLRVLRGGKEAMVGVCCRAARYERG